MSNILYLENVVMTDKVKSRLPNTTVARIVKGIGTDVRVSEAAVNMIGAKAEEYIEELARKALEYANHAGRKTIKETDVEMISTSTPTQE